jgi:hypothetical protein
MKKAHRSVIAITSQENHLKAVQLAKRAGAFELLWARSIEGDVTDLADFAAECGLSITANSKPAGAGYASVVGFDSAGVVFYRLEVPAVKEDELAAMINLQTEALLPLPSSQMESAWRKSTINNSQVSVTLAAAKKERLLQFIEQVRAFKPSGILLDCEGVVKSWKEFFSGTGERTVIVNCGRSRSHVCLAEEGKLVNAVSLDIGLSDFADTEESYEQTQAAERFVQDIRSVLELFDAHEADSTDLCVLSDGNPLIVQIVDYLNQANIKAVEALVDIEKIKSPTQVSAEDIREYSAPIGLASLALEGGDDYLNLFERLYQPVTRKDRKRWYHSLKLTVPLMTVLALLLMLSFYGSDVMSLKELGDLQSGADFQQLIKQQELITQIARQRPDLLGILNEIGSGERGRIMLDGFAYTKGQPMRITGQAEKQEELFKFQKSLREKKNFQDVVITSMAPDEKGKKTNFTITFHYKNFTKKKGGSAL